MRAILLALSLTACAGSPAAPVSADSVIAAERAFAARAGEIGWVPAFREYAAPDGELALPDGYASAPETLAAAPDDGNRNLFWWPAFAGIARSGDLGFTTGVVSFDEARTPRGHYFTVWRRQADGNWRWIYDGGVGPIAEPAQIEIDAANVPVIPVAAAGGESAEAAQAVRDLEEQGALVFASDARAYRTGLAPFHGAPAGDPGGIAYEVHRIEASAAGDLVMVLGQARWQDGEGLYARMWQMRPDGWRVVYDQLILPRPAPPAN